MDYNKEIFKGKTIAKLMEEAYKDKNEKSNQLRSMISQLKDLGKPLDFKVEGDSTTTN